MAPSIITGMAALRQMKAGMDVVTDLVGVTFGPKGCPIVLDRPYGRSLLTDNGACIAREITSLTGVPALGLRMMQEVARRMETAIGDGATTAMVLLQALVQEGLQAIERGSNPLILGKGLDCAVHTAVDLLAACSRPADTYQDEVSVAAVAAGDYSAGQLVAGALREVTPDGIVTVEETERTDTVFSAIHGLTWDGGYVSSDGMADLQGESVVMDNAYLLMTDHRLLCPVDILPLLKEFSNSRIPLLLVATAIGYEVREMLAVNRQRGTVDCVAVVPTSDKEWQRDLLDDMAVLTGGEVIRRMSSQPLSAIRWEQLGRAARVQIRQDRTIITGGRGHAEAIRSRAQALRHQREQEPDAGVRRRLHRRLAMLCGGLGVIQVGAPTSMERQMKVRRIQTALSAVQAAHEEGIVAGGGAALVYAAQAVRRSLAKYRGDQRLGAALVVRALEAPLHRLAGNAGLDGAVIVNRLCACGDPWYGYDVYSDRFCNMLAMGIVDPVRTVRTALQTAASAARLALAAHVVVSPDCL